MKQEKLREIIKSGRLNMPVKICDCCGGEIKMNSQEKLAKYIGCSRAYLSMVENGHEKVTPKTFVLFCAYVGKKLIEYENELDSEFFEKCIDEKNKILKEMSLFGDKKAALERTTYQL